MGSFYLYPLGDPLGIKLSDINRTFERNPVKLAKDRILTNGSLRRDLIATKRTFALGWRFLPDASANVADAGMGTAALETLITDDSNLVLRVPNDIGAGYTDYTVVVEGNSFKKTLVLLRSSRKKYWDVSFTLKEI